MVSKKQEETNVINLTLAPKELDEVTNELTERIRDISFMNLNKRVREAITEALQSCSEDSESFVIVYEIEMTIGDIQQVIGRIRRRTLKA